jgi:hypothetical protein
MLSFIPPEFYVEQDQTMPDVTCRVRCVPRGVQQVGVVPDLDRRSGKRYGQRTFTVTLPVSSCRSDP